VDLPGVFVFLGGLSGQTADLYVTVLISEESFDIL